MIMATVQRCDKCKKVFGGVRRSSLHDGTRDCLGKDNYFIFDLCSNCTITFFWNKIAPCFRDEEMVKMIKEFLKGGNAK